MERAVDFVVVTQGHCFLCRHKIEIDIKCESILESIVKRNQSANQSIQYISRYLKMDMSKVFVSGGAVPPHLLEKVQRSRLKVELCNDCSRLNDTFSRLFRKLEKVEIEEASCMDKIANKLANKDDEGRNSFPKLTKYETNDVGLLEKLKIAEALRADAVQKCNQKLKVSKGCPRIKVKKLSPEEIPRKKVRYDEHSYRERDGSVVSGRWSHTRVVGFTEAESEHWDASDNMEADDAMAIDDNYQSVWTSRSHNSIDIDKSQYSVDSKTGKVKSNLCLKEFANSGGFPKHYRSVHLKLGFKCNICNADFVQSSSLLRHQRKAHFGERVKCKYCSRAFSSATEKLSHMETGCDKFTSRTEPDEISQDNEAPSNDII